MNKKDEGTLLYFKYPLITNKGFFDMINMYKGLYFSNLTNFYILDSRADVHQIFEFFSKNHSVINLPLPGHQCLPVTAWYIFKTGLSRLSTKIVQLIG